VTTEFGSSGKWLELLKEMAPKVTRVAVLRVSDNPAAIAQFGALQAVAPSLSVELRPLDVRDAGQLERAFAAFARAENGGLIVAPCATASTRRDLIIGLAARYRLPAVYALRTAVAAGGMASYGYDEREVYKGAAGYVDRILKGEKPGELPVQAPNKLELVINLKTAKALGLDVPANPLARADEVIE
jgi:putative ABC transport system substrate-binding protein